MSTQCLIGNFYFFSVFGFPLAKVMRIVAFQPMLLKSTHRRQLFIFRTCELRVTLNKHKMYTQWVNVQLVRANRNKLNTVLSKSQYNFKL